MTLSTILIIIAIILMLCEAFRVPSRVSLGFLGLAIWALSLVIGGMVNRYLDGSGILPASDNTRGDAIKSGHMEFFRKAGEQSRKLISQAPQISQRNARRIAAKTAPKTDYDRYLARQLAEDRRRMGLRLSRSD